MQNVSSSDVAPYVGATLTTASRVISDREAAIVTGILREFSQFQVARTTLAGHCEEIAELILPTSRNTFYYQNYNTPGAKKTQQQVDSTGALALHRFCAIADSLVTPRNMHWHGLQGDDYVMKDRASRLWFENTTNLLFRQRYAAYANFAAQNYNNWQSLGAFGNSTMYIDKFDNRWHGGGRGLRYKSVPFGETFYGENHQGKVDRMIRWFRLTAYQAVQKWGREALPENLVGPLNQDSQWGYNFLHCVRPRGDDYDPEALDERSLPFQSFYVSIEGRCLMQPESGYRVFPFAVSRYDQTPGECYGRGPAMLVLPSLKTLNLEKSIFLKSGHRAADPVLLMADDGIVAMNLRPGAQNKGGVTADGKPLVHVLQSGDIQISEKMMGEERSIIDDVFLVSLFKVLSENPNMTATQVIELVNEKGMLVAPTLGRQHTEYIGGMVPRELDLLADMRLIERMPPRLAEAMRGVGLSGIGIKDTSPLAEAANAGKAAGFMRTIESVKELVNITQDQSLLFPFAFKRAIPAIAQIQNVPTDWMSTDQEVAAQEKALAQSKQRQEQIQAMPAQAAMMKAQATVAKNQPGIAPGQAFGGPQQGAPQ
jgi:Bacteriophage head to tail connecting protein